MNKKNHKKKNTLHVPFNMLNFTMIISKLQKLFRQIKSNKTFKTF